ncbi:MAG TPA: adenosine deaminase [Herpetosiphonaceae bacterium]
MSLETFIRTMPKVELHVHLEGSIRPKTLLKLARRNNITLPARTLEQLREFYRFTDFAHFIQVYATIINCLQTPDDFALIAEEFGATMAEQNIRYAEITWSPVTHVGRLGIPFRELLAGVNRGRAAAREKHGVEMRWIVDIVRNLHAKGFDGMETAEMAVEGRDQGVIALGLGGMEQGFPPELFTAAFDYAIANGLHSVPHAGEAAGADSVWGAIRALKAERIGHGIRSIEDPALIDELRARQIPLEVCPTSNVCTAVVADLAAHPIRQFYDAGVYITVNSDDPPMFNTTLTNEYMQLASRLGFDAAAIERLVLNGLRAALLDAETKQTLEASFRAEFGQLRAMHLRA